MSAKLSSSIKRWPGHVLLPDYMTFKQLETWDALLRNRPGEEAGAVAGYAAFLPFICQLVVEWHIDGLPEQVDPDNFPASPALLSWLFEAASNLFNQTNGETDPN